MSKHLCSDSHLDEICIDAVDFLLSSVKLAQGKAYFSYGHN
jgi:hypothetical protein